MLKNYYEQGRVEAGCDEAGRGCLAGSVYAAAVILPPDYHNERLNDSKKLTARQRYTLRQDIERDAVAWAAKNGITGGIGGGLFGSDNNCTRAQIVTFLYRNYQSK